MYNLESGGLGPSPTLEDKWEHICNISSEKDAIRVAKLLSMQLGRVRISGIITQFKNGRLAAPPRDPSIYHLKVESVDPDDPELCMVFRFVKNI